MALDVHIVDTPNRKGITEGRCGLFEEHVHDYIFYGCGVDIYNRYAYLRRMMDYYADASYTGNALDSVVAEIDDHLPNLTASKEATKALTSFRLICMEARAAGRSVFLNCD